jgi:hypothetical protein
LWVLPIRVKNREGVRGARERKRDTDTGIEDFGVAMAMVVDAGVAGAMAASSRQIAAVAH